MVHRTTLVVEVVEQVEQAQMVLLQLLVLEVLVYKVVFQERLNIMVAEAELGLIITDLVKQAQVPVV
jgi:hypothetical protein